ncbi:MAG: MCP four helix bundle domain-containing protein, partial [Negativicutes bacterium]|nr:MCP four helix bundle domain-containing protein [Negativicutes bacterium]
MRWFYDLKIMTRLLIGFVVVAALAGVVGYVGIKNIHAIDDSDTILYEKNTVPIALLQDITEGFQRARYNVLEMAIADSPEKRDAAVKKLVVRRDEITKASSEYEKLILSPEMKQAFADYMAARKNYVALVQDPVIALTAAGRNAEALQLINTVGENARTLYQDAIEKMITMKLADAKKRSDENAAQASAASRNMMIVIAMAFLLAILLGWFIARSVSNPVNKMMTAAERLALGDVHATIDISTRDEVGNLARALQSVVANINNAANASERIAKGDLTIRLKELSDKDTLSKSMNTCIDNIKTLIADAEMLAVAAVGGKLDTRADASKHDGDFRKIVEGVNQTLDAVIGPLNVAAEYVDRISKGDIPPKITDNYNGDFNEIKNNLNNCIDNINALVTDAALLAKAAVEGQLETRADASKHDGDFRKIVEGVNQTLDAVIGPLNVTAEYVERISKGDIPPKITDHYNGDFNEIKNNLNNCIDIMNGLLKETGELIEATKDGKLDRRGNAAAFAGGWGQLVDGVN